MGIAELCPEVRQFVFEAEMDNFAFTPGQFVSLVHEFEGREVTRAYSIASAPAGNRFELCLNRVKEGIFSPWLFEMNSGDTVEMKGPLGYFVLRNPARDALFVATGTGIAPIRSILQANLSGPRPARITLLFGARYPASLLYRAEFDTIAALWPGFRFWPTVTRPDNAWTGRTGRVQQHLLEAIGDRRDIDVYICGLKEMVDDVRTVLKCVGFDRKQIIVEKYD
ncbi:MAG TPA: FAD-dependent oxidoreductase [Bryobacteraceae bacterium]|nr:FAD-dependent oxidoreductase [Bryobacteraceae bacterium]